MRKNAEAPCRPCMKENSMSAKPSAGSGANRRYAIPIYLALIAAGLAGNVLKFSLLNADFIFGSIFAMLALQLFGLGRGIVAAAIIAGYTYLAWNHPWAVVTMTAEAAVVGWLISRRKLNLVTADILYWLIIGIPLGYLCFHLISDFPVSNTLFLMTKQAVNGIANALVARLIFSGYAFRFRSSRISFREIVANLLTFFVLCPALIMLAVSGRADLAETDRQIRSSLIQDSRRVTDNLEDWHENRKIPIIHLAEMAATHSPAQMQPRLEQIRSADVNFLRIALLDRKADITAISPLLDEFGKSSIGKNFADRPFIPTLKRTLKPMLSEVVVARVGAPKPMVTILAPVVRDGKYDGYVTGILNFDRIETIMKINFTGREIEYTLMDKNGKVIITSRKDQKAMTPFSRGQGTLGRTEEGGIARWIPALPSNVSTIDLWGKSFYVAESTIGSLAEWNLILEQPVAPFQKRLYDSYTGKMSLLFLVLLASLALAEFLSRGMVSTIRKLAEITHDLPAKLVSEDRIAWPESAMLETHHLISNSREMADSLTANFVENRQMNESLEQRVEERTHQLQTNEERLSNAMEMAHLSHWEYDVANDLFTFNDQFYKIFHTTAKQVGGYTMSSSEYARRFVHPDDIPVVGEETRKAVESTDPHYSRRLEHRMLYADGTIGHIAVLFFIVKDANGRTVRTYGVNQDITARKRAEEEVRKINAELEQRIADRTRDLGDSQLALLNVVDDLNRHSKNLDGANEKLAAANKELEAFSYSVSHDLRAPLRHLGGFVELLKEKLPPSTDEETGHYLKVISDSAAQMSRLVDDLLSFSRMGRAEMSKARVRFDKLVDEAIDTLQPATRGREIAWKIAPLPEVTGDASMLRLVMVNLIANAVKFTGSRPKAEIEIRCDQSNEDEYIFSVGDNGAGFDMKYTDKLFHLFQRLHRADEFEGTGAGLANVRRIVQRHGGRTWAEGAVGNGAVFYFSLPRGTPVER